MFLVFLFFSKIILLFFIKYFCEKKMTSFFFFIFLGIIIFYSSTKDLYKLNDCIRTKFYSGSINWSKFDIGETIREDNAKLMGFLTFHKNERKDMIYVATETYNKFINPIILNITKTICSRNEGFDSNLFIFEETSKIISKI